MSDMTAQTTAEDQTSKEAYFTASQRQLIWARFKKQTRGDDSGDGAGVPDAVGPVRAVPVALRPDDCRARQGLHQRRTADAAVLRLKWLLAAPVHPRGDAGTLDGRRIFVGSLRWTRTFACRCSSSCAGDKYKLFGFIPGNVHLFGVEGGKIHLFGTDEDGRTSSRARSTRSGRLCKSAPSAW